MTNDLDQQLKRLLLSGRPPDLPAGFVDRTVALMLGDRSAPLALAGGPTVRHHTRRNRWLLALALVATLSVAWQWHLSGMMADDDLMSVDTLSMSSLLAL